VPTELFHFAPLLATLMLNRVVQKRWAVKEAELRAALATAQLERESTTNDNQKRRGSQGKASSSNEATGAGASAGAGAATGDSVDHSSSDSSDSTTTADTNATGTTTAAATTNTTSSKSPLPTAADGRLMGHSSSRLGHLEAPTNIFSGAASSQVLTADLLNLIRQQDALGLKVIVLFLLLLPHANPCVYSVPVFSMIRFQIMLSCFDLSGSYLRCIFALIFVFIISLLLCYFCCGCIVITTLPKFKH